MAAPRYGFQCFLNNLFKRYAHAKHKRGSEDFGDFDGDIFGFGSHHQKRTESICHSRGFFKRPGECS